MHACMHALGMHSWDGACQRLSIRFTPSRCLDVRQDWYSGTRCTTPKG